MSSPFPDVLATWPCVVDSRTVEALWLAAEGRAELEESFDDDAKEFKEPEADPSLIPDV